MHNVAMNPLARYSQTKNRNGNRRNEDWRPKCILTYGCNVHRTQQYYAYNMHTMLQVAPRQLSLQTDVDSHRI